ncbi:site-specific integrase [Chryseobacterium limigenitum]|uniref:Phage integrase family protein n=1 Tax=Chryseobacterium limigenitum TaxID=1612149 RepID=A0A1K2IT10_9FLAO|nr:site-specific integrase [Chryseobacterium limigenitum]SFZ95495.1 Phage integrase family protein [Chryseobacterium limigenitum]
MATIKFIIQSKKQNSTIYSRLSIGAGKVYKRKTRETVNPEDWNAKKGSAIQRTALSKESHHKQNELVSILNKLETFILEQYSKRTETEIINGDWLDEIIEAFYSGGRKADQLSFIDNYLEHYKVNILPFRKYRGKSITEGTKENHLTIITKFYDFLKTEKKRLKVSDYNIAVGNRFVTFLRGQNLNDNTVGKYLKYTKTIFKDAKIDGIEISEQLNEIKGFSTETPTPYLKVEELEKIQELLIVNERLEQTRDWLIIGCYTGQRASDLFRMTPDKIITINGKEFINLSQKKTKTPVLVPIHAEVKKILNKRNGSFPAQYSDNIESSKTIFNDNLKKICKLAGIDRIEYGRVYNEVKKYYVFGNYPMHDLASSHLCRRTFATMYYSKIPTAIIMSVTGHKTETEFLGYIGIDNSTLSEQMYSYWEQLDSKENKFDSQIKNAN